MNAATPIASLLAGASGAIPPTITFDAPPLRRLKLWNLEEKFHCPVIGTCLSMEELVRFARRFHFAAELRDEFALHVEANRCSMARNEFAETLQKHFDRKYAVALKRFDAARCDAEVLALWRDSIASGEVAAPMWAALTHKHAGEDTRNTVYADIHMLSHQVGAGKAADTRRLAILEQENAALRGDLSKAKEREATLTGKLNELKAKLQRLGNAEQEAAKLRERLTRLENGTAMIEIGRRLVKLELANQRLMAGSQRVWELEKTLAASRDAASRFAAERDQLAAERDAMERMLIEEEGCDGECDSACPLSAEADGEARSVLCVGGRTGLITQYRNLAQRPQG
ncbi:MAG: hypothetical protein A2Z95_01945 [Gallionellales bacterium GWA2_60_18]|nr:MAG: hypothetical protein A2Z95_01945 [Gallionellales bacterium GWA2_60_18]